MIRLPGWKPPVIASRSRKPEGVPVSALGQAVELVELLVEHLGDLAEVLLAVVSGDLEHRPLGALDELAGAGGVVGEHALLDAVRGLEQPPHEGVLDHDLGVAAGVAGGGHGGGEFVDRRRPPGALELALLAQALDHGELVDRLAFLVQTDHRPVDEGVAVAVEVLRFEALLDHERVHRAVGEQDRAQHRLLRLEVVGRRQRQRAGRAVALGGGRRAHRGSECRSVRRPPGEAVSLTAEDSGDTN